MTPAPMPDPVFLKDVQFDNKVHLVEASGPFRKFENYIPGVQGKIVVMYLEGEYHFWNDVEDLLCKAKNYHKMHNKLNNYYIFLSRVQYEPSLFTEYGDYFSLIYDLRLYGHLCKSFEPVQYNKNIKYHFLSLNNHAQCSRQSAFYFFNKFSLLEKSYFSYRGYLGHTKYNSYKEISDKIINQNAPWYVKNLDLDKIHKSIPYTIPDDNFENNDWTYGQLKFYSETFCSVIFETFDNQEYPFFTEKIFKPIVYLHPFIVHSNPFSLKLLHDLGFKTFHDFWDESYDELGGNERLEAIFHLLLEIANWPLTKLEDLQKNIIPILEHNQNHFFNVLPRMYQDCKHDTIEKINNIFEMKKNLL